MREQLLGETLSPRGGESDPDNSNKRLDAHVQSEDDFQPEDVIQLPRRHSATKSQNVEAELCECGGRAMWYR